MVSVSQYSFALVCVILLMTPFNTFPSTEARQPIRQKSFNFASFDFNGLFQKLNDLLTKGFSAVGGSLDLSLGSGKFVLYPTGIFIALPALINNAVLDELSTCTENILGKLGVDQAADLLVELSGTFTSASLSGVIASKPSLLFVFDNGVFVKYQLDANAMIQTFAAYVQKLPQLFEKLVGLPKCLMS